MQAISAPQDCCSTCPDPVVTNIPGAAGADGAAGAGGAAGVSAFTFVADYAPNPQPEMPFPIQIISTTLAAGSTTAVMADTTLVVPGMRVSGTGIPAGTTISSVDTATDITLSLQATANGAQSVTYRDQVTVNTTTSTDFLAVGAMAYVQNWGYMLVLSQPSDTSIQLENVEDASTSAYAVNVAQGTTLAAASSIVPTGPQGVTGVTPSGAALIANNLGDAGFVAATMRTNLGLGTTAVQNVADVFQVANNLSEGTAATKRTNLGLGTMATQAASAVAITGGTLNGTLGGTTPASAVVTTLSASGAATVTGAATLNGNLTNSAKMFAPSSAIQSLLAATAINPNATCIRVVGNGAARTLTATPTITAPAADGQLLLIRGTDDTNTVTLQDEASLAGTGLSLSAATRVLGAGDQIFLAWDSTTSLWWEIAFANN